MNVNYSTKTPKNWYSFYLFIFAQFAIVFTIGIPFMVYVVGPLLKLVVHEIPFSVGLEKAVSLGKLSKFILFATFDVTTILWLQKFIPWYLKQRRKNKSSSN